MLGGNRRRCRSLLQIRRPWGDALRLQLLQNNVPDLRADGLPR